MIFEVNPFDIEMKLKLATMPQVSSINYRFAK